MAVSLNSRNRKPHSLAVTPTSTAECSRRSVRRTRLSWAAQTRERGGNRTRDISRTGGVSTSQKVSGDQSAEPKENGFLSKHSFFRFRSSATFPSPVLRAAGGGFTKKIEQTKKKKKTRPPVSRRKQQQEIVRAF